MSTADPFNGRFIGTPQELPHVCGRYGIKKTLLDIWAHLWARAINPPVTTAAVIINLFREQPAKSDLEMFAAF